MKPTSTTSNAFSATVSLNIVVETRHLYSSRVHRHKLQEQLSREKKVFQAFLNFLKELAQDGTRVQSP